MSERRYRDVCPGCGRAIALFTRDGQHVADEWHAARQVEADARLVGWGTSGLGLWSGRREWVCDRGVGGESAR
jgi:hypothetical protein